MVRWLERGRAVFWSASGRNGPRELRREIPRTIAVSKPALPPFSCFPKRFEADAIGRKSEFYA